MLAEGPLNVKDPVKTIGACVPELFSPIKKMWPFENVIFSATVFPLSKTNILGFVSLTDNAAKSYAEDKLLNGHLLVPVSLYESVLRKST